MRNNVVFYMSIKVKDDAPLKHHLPTCHCMFEPTKTLLGHAILD